MVTLTSDDNLHLIVFPENISYGMNSSWGFNNTIVNTKDGAESVIRGWSKAKHSYSFSENQVDDDTLKALQTFYLNRRGEQYRFLFKDPMDFTYDLDGQTLYIPTSDLNNYKVSLVKTYTDPKGYKYKRKITRAKTTVGSPVEISPATDGYYLVNGTIAPAPDTIVDVNAPTVTIYRRCTDYKDTGDPYSDPTKESGLEVTNASDSYTFAEPLTTNFSIIDPPLSVLAWISGAPDHDPPIPAHPEPEYNPTNLTYIKFQTAVASGAAQQYIRIECYFLYSSDGTNRIGGTLPLQRIIPPITGRKYYGTVSVSGVALDPYPATSYCFFRDDSNKYGSGGDSGHYNYFEGDPFCYRVICYTTTDPAGNWLGNPLTGDPTTGCSIVWQKYTPIILLVYGDRTDPKYKPPIENKELVYVPGTNAVYGNPLLTVVETYMPVRFSMKSQDTSIDAYNNSNWKNIKIVESGE